MIPMYVWLRWKLGHKEFKPYGRSNPAVRPHIGIGGPGEQPVPARWWAELKARWWSRNPTWEEMQAADPVAIWRTIGYFTAWGFGNGQFVDSAKVKAGTVTADDLRPTILKLQARGAKWVGVQDLVVTRGMKAALKTVCKQQGLKLVVWDRYYKPDKVQAAVGAVAYWEPDAFVVNIEDAGNWLAFASTLAAHYPALPRAVWTNFPGAGAMPDGTYSIEQAKVWWGAGYVCITEAYVNENPVATPAQLDWTARVKLGYPEVFPSIGIYRGWRVEDYEQMLYAFPAYSVYLAEYLPELP